jgi:hypothetical protein
MNNKTNIEDKAARVREFVLEKFNELDDDIFNDEDFLTICVTALSNLTCELFFFAFETEEEAEKNRVIFLDYMNKIIDNILKVKRDRNVLN